MGVVIELWDAQGPWRRLMVPRRVPVYEVPVIMRSPLTLVRNPADLVEANVRIRRFEFDRELGDGTLVYKEVH